MLPCVTDDDLLTGWQLLSRKSSRSEAEMGRKLLKVDAWLAISARRDNDGSDASTSSTFALTDDTGLRNAKLKEKIDDQTGDASS